MKKLWVVLLSLGLVMAFSMSAFAVSADFTGQYYLRQNYTSNPSLMDQDKGAGRGPAAFTDQRLRLFTRLKVVEGVTLTTRMDLLESVWGKEQAMMPPSGLPATPSSKQMRDFNIGNVSVEQLYLNFNTAIGTFIVGNKSGTPFQWGTWFLNNSGTAAGIYWTKTFGNYTVIADLAKTSKGDMATVAASGEIVKTQGLATDRDRDYYDLAVQYKGKDLEGGLMFSYFRFASGRTAAGGSLDTALFLNPYAKAKFGPVDLEFEGYYTPYGKRQYDNPTTNQDQNYKAKGFYVQGKYNMGPAWAGAAYVYASGADTTATAAKGDDITGTVLSQFGYGTDNYSGLWSNYTPNILMGYASDSYHSFIGNAAGPATGQTTDNLKLLNLIAGVAVGKTLNFDGKLSFAKLDKAPTGWDDSLGTELDLRGTYKIYDCLSYGVGFAYLWTGDYFKAGVAATPTANNYYVTHWLDLRF